MKYIFLENSDLNRLHRGIYVKRVLKLKLEKIIMQIYKKMLTYGIARGTVVKNKFKELYMSDLSVIIIINLVLALTVIELLGVVVVLIIRNTVGGSYKLNRIKQMA